jgi:orotate phosphoribosyltransferase
MQSWLVELQNSCSYWHEEQPLKVHALLASGKHSNGYINLREFSKENPARIRDIVFDFYLRHKAELLEVFKIHGIDYIHGPAMGGLIPAFELANLLEVGFIYTEKQEIITPDKKTTRMVCNFDDLENKHVLLMEDVISTGSTNAKSVTALIGKGAKIVGPLCTLINRSGKTELSGQKILSLIEIQFDIYNEESCPWCKTGSKVVKPKLLWKTFS